MNSMKPPTSPPVWARTLETKAVSNAKCSQESDQVSAIVHEINNMICSLRLIANNLLLETQFGETANDMLDISRRIEALVTSLASLAKNCTDSH